MFCACIHCLHKHSRIIPWSCYVLQPILPGTTECTLCHKTTNEPPYFEESDDDNDDDDEDLSDSMRCSTNYLLNQVRTHGPTLCPQT